MITIDDIQIFVTTHNRSDLIKETLESILMQTIKPDHIIVLDNDSTDNTQDIVKDYHARGVEYIPTSGFLGNIKKAKDLANKKYCMLFHDDDLLHPEYLQNALELLNKYPNVSMITSSYMPFIHGKKPVISSHLSKEHLLFNTPRKWASYMYFVEGICYASAIYRTEDFLKTDIEYESFNKYCDWPFLAKFGLHGNVIFMPDKNCVYYRQHSGSDSNNVANYPNLEQIVNWDKCFFTLMGNPTWKDFLYWFYGCYNKHYIAGKYKGAPQYLKEKNSLSDLKKIIKQKGLPTWSFTPLGRLLKHILQFFNLIGPKSSFFWTK